MIHDQMIHTSQMSHLNLIHTSKQINILFTQYYVYQYILHSIVIHTY